MPSPAPPPGLVAASHQHNQHSYPHSPIHGYTQPSQQQQSQISNPNAGNHHNLGPTAQDILFNILSLNAHGIRTSVDGGPSNELNMSNTSSLFQILNNLLTISSEHFPPAVVSKFERLVVEEDFNDLSPQVQALAPMVLSSTWNIKQLTDILADISKALQGEDVRAKEEIENAWEMILEKAMKSASDLILIGFSLTERPWSEAHTSIVASLLAMFIKGQPTSQLVMSVLGRTQPDMVVEGLQKSHEENDMNVNRVVECGQDAQVLDKLLSSPSLPLALDVAAVASKRDLMDLESWVVDGIEKHGDDLIQALLDFLDRKVHAESSVSDGQPDTVPLSPAVYATFFRTLRNSNNLTADDIGHFKEIRNLCLQLHPRLMNLNPEADTEPGLSVVAFPPEIDAQVDDFYQRMYAEEISLDHVIEVFQRLKKSEARQDRQLFACMLHTLFDEYKFVQTYPPRELAMTGLLFGSIIQYHLVEGTPLHVAVRYVLDALQSDPETTMFSFGKNALNIFQSRLPEFPSMCRALLEISHLQESSPVLMSIIRTALTERNVDSEENSRPVSPERVVFPALQVETLDQEQLENMLTVPEERTSDKILFIVNNLAPSNFEEKAEDLKKLIVTRYSRWFADYLVNTRISVEPNNHNLYLQLIEHLSLAILEQHILYETYRKSASLLNSAKTLESSHDKIILKNIASWLGKLTVARDLPIRHRQLSLKDLLIQGYDEKRLQVAIPFVCKLMEHCSKSKVFHPPNPWLMAVMKLLSELYQFAELKLNLKFEIEVLCKTLDIDLSLIEPSNILRRRTPSVPANIPRLAQELDRITMQPSSGYMSNATVSGGQPAGSGEAAQQAIQEAFIRRVDELVGQLPSQLLFNPAYPMFQSTPALKRVVHHSIDRALREIINPVVERSVTIAGISSRDLLMKDFGMESDDTRLRQAAHLMVSKLAGSLALVTCKEPLRTSMLNNIRTMSLQTGFTEETLPEQAIIGTVQDNLDIACNIIKTAAQEKAVKDIDVNLTPAYASRRKHREAGQLFMDPSSFSNIVSRSALPESLRLIPHGLQNAQLRVYEDFGDQSRFTASIGQSEGEYAQSLNAGQNNLERNVMQGGDPSIPLGEVVESSIMTSKLTVTQSLEKFQELVTELDKLLGRSEYETLAQFPLHHDVKMIIRQIPVIATQSAYADQTALSFSQKAVQLLYKSQDAVSREVWVSILQRLCDLFAKVAKEVTLWLIYAEDVRKFNVPVTVTLIRAGLINVPEFDAQLSRLIYREFSQTVIDFAALLIMEAVLGPESCASRSQFTSSIEAIERAAANRRGTPSASRLLENLQQRGQYSPTSSEHSDEGGHAAHRAQGPPGSQSIDPDLRATLNIYFLEWVRLFTSPLPVETTFVPFVNRLQKQGILKGEEISSAFYRNSIALAIDMFNKHKASGLPQMFHGVDALSRLIALLLKNYSDTHGVSSDSAKTLYFAKIITIAALSLVRDHEELGSDFEQRPYFRFFSSLLCDLQIIQSSFPDAYYGCLQTFANHLGSIQPTIAPAFSYSWISLISHRHFMPRLLQANNKEGWTDFYRVLMALFKFLNPFLESAHFHQGSRTLFKGALRILLVILKDFPEFLVEHYIGLCAAIPAHCIQLRNVVLCAFPRGVTLRLDVNSLSEVPPLPEFNQVPEIHTDYVKFLEDGKIRQAVDRYTADENPNPAALVPELRNRIAISVPGADGGPSVKYNLTLLYSLSLYLGSSAVNRSIERNGRVTFDPQGPEITLLTSLIASLDGEGQHHFINSIVNQLRYPNAHTLFFMLYVLHLFSTAPKNGEVPERITRVLLERVLAQRPHPWGLTMAFGELLHNEKLGFWDFPWVRNEPELFAIFQRCYGKGHL